MLQGSVRLQVNAGPLEIASTFLASPSTSKHPPEQLKQLNSAFHSFRNCCGQALRLNKLLITHDQIEYQEDLELGFEDMKSKFSQYLFLDEIHDTEETSNDESRVSNLLSFFMDGKSNVDIHSFFRS